MAQQSCIARRARCRQEQLTPPRCPAAAQWRLGRPLDRTNMFEREIELSSDGELAVRVAQSPEGDTGVVVWDAAIVLAKYLETARGRLVGRSVIGECDSSADIRLARTRQRDGRRGSGSGGTGVSPAPPPPSPAPPWSCSPTCPRSSS